VKNFTGTLRQLDELKRGESGHAYSLWDTLSNDCNGPDLGIFHELHSGLVNTPGRGKVHDGINIRVLGHRLVYALVNGEESLAGSPVHLADELSTEGIDDARHGWCGALADKVEIQHALDGSWLQTVHEASCLVVEESMLSTRAQRPARGSKATDVIVGIRCSRGQWCRSGAAGDGGRHGGGIVSFCNNNAILRQKNGLW